jgi:hypothetical protein
MLSAMDVAELRHRAERRQPADKLDWVAASHAPAATSDHAACPSDVCMKAGVPPGGTRQPGRL